MSQEHPHGITIAQSMDAETIECMLSHSLRGGTTFSRVARPLEWISQARYRPDLTGRHEYPNARRLGNVIGFLPFGVSFLFLQSSLAQEMGFSSLDLTIEGALPVLSSIAAAALVSTGITGLITENSLPRWPRRWSALTGRSPSSSTGGPSKFDAIESCGAMWIPSP